MEVHVYKLKVLRPRKDYFRTWWMAQLSHNLYKRLQISLHLAQDHSLPEPEKELVE